ncbi:MAG TPA: GspH/FimT family pseudopilin [Burkholderiaceae bacterium]|nr:GspH/FimT family pseudopilin [Burkholderiaceae bacterium]
MSRTGKLRITRHRPTAATLSRGLTLVELLVTITILSVLVSAAVPSFTYALAGYRVSGQINGWLGDLQYTRAEAIKRGQTVTICISSDGATCVTGSSSWQQGWMVFADANGNALVDAGEAVLRKQAALNGNNTFVADNSVRSITFNRDGFAAGLPAGNVTLTLHDSTGQSGLTRCVAVTTVGRTSVQKHGAGNCS